MYSSQWIWVTNFPSDHHYFPEEREMDVQSAFAVWTYTSLLLNFLTAWNKPLASQCCWRQQMTSEQMTFERMTSVLLSNRDSSSKQSFPLPCPFALSQYWRGQLLAQGDGADWEKVYVSLYLWMQDPSQEPSSWKPQHFLHLNAIHGLTRSCTDKS